MLPSGGAAAAETKSAAETLEKLRSVIWDFFQKRHIGYYIAFIILYRLAEGFVMKIIPLFLKAERSAGGLGLAGDRVVLRHLRSCRLCVGLFAGRLLHIAPRTAENAVLPVLHL